MAVANSKDSNYEITDYNGYKEIVSSVYAIDEAGSYTYFIGHESLIRAVKTERIIEIARVD